MNNKMTIFGVGAAIVGLVFICVKLAKKCSILKMCYDIVSKEYDLLLDEYESCCDDDEDTEPV